MSMRSILRLVAFLFTVLTSLQAQHTAKGVSFLNHTKQENGVTLELGGTLYLPQSASSDNRAPAALIIPGSGKYSEEFMEGISASISLPHTYKVIAQHLADNGIACLVVDKRGYGRSANIKKKIFETTLDDSTSDALAGISFLSSQEEINPEKIGIIGHSEGGLIGYKVAQKHALSFFIGLATLAMKGKVLIDYGDMLSSLLNTFGIPNPQKLIQQLTSSIHFDRDPIEIIDEWLCDIASTYKLQHNAEYLLLKEDYLKKRSLLTQTVALQVLDYDEDRRLLHTTPHQMSLIHYDPTEDIKALNMPMLLLFAEGDPFISYKDNQQALKRIKSKNITSVVIPFGPLLADKQEYKELESSLRHEFMVDTAHVHRSTPSLASRPSDLKTSPLILKHITQFIRAR